MKRQHASVQSKPSKQIKTEVLSDDETTVNENYIPQVREQTNASSVKVEKADDTPERVISIIQNQRGTLAQLTDILQLKPDLNVYIDGGTALHHCISENREMSWFRKLVAYGADPNKTNEYGWHPRHLAAMRARTDILSFYAPPEPPKRDMARA